MHSSSGDPSGTPNTAQPANEASVGLESHGSIGSYTRESVASFAALISLVVALTLLVYAADGPRGTDQYWYIADVETLAARSEPVSNTWFPMGIVRADADAGSYRAYFYHNGPLLHLVATIHRNFPVSAYAAWLLINALCLIVTVSVVWMWLRRYTDKATAGWAAALSAIAPVSYWQAANVLRETWFGALTAIAIALYFLAPRRFRLSVEPLLAFVLALGALAHPMFVILLVLLVGVRCGDWLSKRTIANFATIVPSVVALIIVRTYADQWFPSSFQPDLTSIIVSAIPGGTNMAWHFADTQANLDVSFLLAKFGAAFDSQFLRVSSWPIYFQTNAAFFAWMLLAIGIWKRYRPTMGTASTQPHSDASAVRPMPTIEMMLVLGCCLGLYIAIVILQQNHMRFQQLIAPAVFILIGHALFVLIPKKAHALALIPVLLACAVVSTLMARQLLAESWEEREDRAVVSESLAFLESDDRVLFVDLKRHDPLSFVIRPVTALFIRKSLIDDAVAKEAVERFQPTVIITNDTSLPYELVGFDRMGRIPENSLGSMIIWKQSQP